ncbi:hypothetical protein ACI3L1_07620 [Deinococcus sp. SM5_A1]|uniref:hypothetical protein n=1 Tax=Deinococcus sp. SM5_A1 TaxID=3379094 RepID=UPI0038591FA3
MAIRSFDFSERPNGRESRVDLVRIQVGQLWKLRPDLNEVVDDLLDVIAAVHVVDRLVKRSRVGGYACPRHLALTVPVAYPERWAVQRQHLISLLKWLTGDHWDIEFNGHLGRKRTRVPAILSTGAPEMSRPFVGLYSGGLDSLAGAVAQALDPQFDTGILVGGQTGGGLKSLQSVQFAALQERLPQVAWRPFQGFWHQVGAKNLADWFIREQSQEKSQRSRALLFLTIGVITALAHDVDTLHVYENGVGAINLPYTAAFTGADQTRAMHPHTLLLMERWLTGLLERPIHIVNASLWRTKGEMCAQVAAAGLGDLAALTASCDSYPLHHVSHKQCGSCTSCVMRRVSLHAAGLHAEDAMADRYRDDLSHLTAQGGADRRLALRYMQQQAEQFACLSVPGRMLDFRLAFAGLEDARRAIHEHSGLTLLEVDTRLGRLFGQYAREFAGFSHDLTSPTRPVALSPLVA